MIFLPYFFTSLGCLYTEPVVAVGNHRVADIAVGNRAVVAADTSVVEVVVAAAPVVGSPYSRSSLAINDCIPVSYTHLAGEGKRLRLPLPLEITAVDDLRYVERRFLSGRRCFAAVCDRGRCFVYRA